MRRLKTRYYKYAAFFGFQGDENKMTDISFTTGTSRPASQKHREQPVALTTYATNGRVFRAGLCAMFVVLTGQLSTVNGADTVTIKSTNKTVSGDVSEITRDSVSVKSLSRTVKIPANDVAAIKWSKEPAKLNIARGDERRGRFAEALEDYEEIQGSIDSPSAELKTDLEFGIANCTAELALQSEGDNADAVAKLEAFLKANPQSYHYYKSLDLLGRLYAQQQAWDNAERSYKELAKSSLPEYQMTAKIGEGRILLSQGGEDTAAAKAAFEAVIQMDASSPSEKNKQFEAKLGLASCLVREKEYAEALEILDQVVSDTNITDEEVLANAYIQQGKCHMAADQNKLAVLSFLHVDTLLFQARGPHAEALYYLTRLWPQVGKTKRGEDARMKLETNFPDSQWVKQLNDN
ncbi:hypothetical protein Mal52_15920 [Symmachiella dynata]|uniref:Tetratricopeptide repeat protein n=2 Tax=Symmachiella dynata TaxID=2527995 RepID=A0A517ZKU3_9PLAN|nr:hypothetical protein Mal52_15920 [Symmachiella dynata]